MTHYSFCCRAPCYSSTLQVVTWYPCSVISILLVAGGGKASCTIVTDLKGIATVEVSGRTRLLQHDAACGGIDPSH